MSQPTDQRPRVSIVVPAFNEEGIISCCVEELASVMSKTGKLAEVIVVNDGSTDATLSRVRSVESRCPALRVINFQRNYGKAIALREGIKLARADTIALFDADLQYDPADLVKMLDMLGKGSDLVNGRRDFCRYESTRTAFSKIYNVLLNLIFRVNICDSNCGMKVLRRKTADLGFLFRFGTPLMVPLLKLRGFSITERAVSLRERKVGESKFFKSGSFLGGWRHLMGVSYHSCMLLGLLASLAWIGLGQKLTRGDNEPTKLSLP